MSQIQDYNDFETYCGLLLGSLRLGFPVHIGPGSDRGKDIVISAPLQPEARRLYKINVECKFRQKSSLGPDALFSKDFWARADKVDLLLIMTNTRLTAGAADWLRQTAEDRPFPVIVWTGDFIAKLGRDLLVSHSLPDSQRSVLIAEIHQDLLRQISSQSERQLAISYDPRLSTKFAGDNLQQPDVFVDREQELRALTDFDHYRVASVLGPIGIGKSMLAREVLRHAKESGFTPVTLRMPNTPDLCLSQWIIDIAQNLHRECSSSALLESLREFGTRNASRLQDIALGLLQEHRLFIHVEDAHKLGDHDEACIFIESVCSNPGCSRVLATARNSLPWTSWLFVPHIQLELSGFDRTAISDYFRSRTIACPEFVVDKLSTRHAGWPILVAHIGGELIASRPTSQNIKVLLDNASESIGPTLAQNILSKVSPSARSLLAFLVALKISISQSDLAIAAGMSTQSFQAAREELLREGILLNSNQPYDCLHDLLKTCLRSSLTPLAEVHRELGIFLRSGSENPERLVGATEHFLDVPDGLEAARTLVFAGQTLIRCGLPSTLLRLLKRLESEDLPESIIVSLVLLRSAALELKGRFYEAEDTLRTFVYKDILDTMDSRLVTEYHYRLARVLYFRGDYLASASSIHDALAACERGGGPLERESFLLKARSLSLLARLKYINRDIEEAEELYHQALSLHEEFGDRLGANKVRHRLSMIELQRGHRDLALGGFRAVERESRRLSDPKRLSYALHRIGEIEGEKGNTGKARSLFKQSIAIKKRIGHTRGLVFTGLGLARLEIQEGRLNEADSQLLGVMEIFESQEMPKEEAMTWSLLAELRCQQGRAGEARNWFNRAIDRFETLDLPRRAKAVRDKLDANLENEPAN